MSSSSKRQRFIQSLNDDNTTTNDDDDNNINEDDFHNNNNNDDDNESNKQAFGKPYGVVLPTDCGFSEIELQTRIERNDPIHSPEEYLARNLLIQRKQSQQTITIQQSLLTTTESKSTKLQLPTPIPPIHISTNTRNIILYNFTELRHRITQWYAYLEENPHIITLNFPPVNFPQDAPGKVSWLSFCFGVSTNNNTSSNSTITTTLHQEQDQEQHGHPPLIHILLQMQQIQLIRVMRAILSNIETTKTLTDRHAAWLFSVFATIQLPTTSDVYSSIRRLLRVVESISPSSIYREMICVILETVFEQGG
jgi:hypothetical protein